MRVSTVPSGQKNGKTEAFSMVRSVLFTEPAENLFEEYNNSGYAN